MGDPNIVSSSNAFQRYQHRDEIVIIDIEEKRILGLNS